MGRLPHDRQQCGKCMSIMLFQKVYEFGKKLFRLKRQPVLLYIPGLLYRPGLMYRFARVPTCWTSRVGSKPFINTGLMKAMATLTALDGLFVVEVEKTDYTYLLVFDLFLFDLWLHLRSHLNELRSHSNELRSHLNGLDCR